jgi:hypothetical protein
MAITFMVFGQTRSPFLAAIAYASGTVPYLLGGLLFTGLPDRAPYRAVMIGADLARAALTAVMLLPVPLFALAGLLYGVTALQQPFDSARAAVLRDILDDRHYPLGTAVMQVTFRVVFSGGAAIGGLAVAAGGPRACMAADAATFAASAAMIRAAVRYRPAAAALAAAPAAMQPGGVRIPGRRSPGGAASGLRVVFGSPLLRTVMLTGWLAAAYEVPECLAAPYAASVGGGPAAAGLLIAAGQAMVFVAPGYARLPGPVRRRWMGPMAAGACAVLTLTALHPGIPAAMAVLAAVSVLGTYQVTANTAFAENVPAEYRGRAFTIAATGLVTAQGIAFAVAGAAAQQFSPATVCAAAGGLGALAAGTLAVSWRRLCWGN